MFIVKNETQPVFTDLNLGPSQPSRGSWSGPSQPTHYNYSDWPGQSSQMAGPSQFMHYNYSDLPGQSSQMAGPSQPTTYPSQPTSYPPFTDMLGTNTQDISIDQE